MQLAIASGKGGTGKTTVAANLALLMSRDLPVTLADCDVEEPNVRCFLAPPIRSRSDVTVAFPVVDMDTCDSCGLCAEACQFNAINILGGQSLLSPELCHGCGACALVCPLEAITESRRAVGSIRIGEISGLQVVEGRLNVGEAMAPPVIEAVKAALGTGLAILDCSPGTSCSMVAAVRGVDLCLLVSEPTPFGLSDLTLALDVARQLQVPTGLIINRYGMADAQRLEQLASEHSLPVVARLPFDLSMAKESARGLLAVSVSESWSARFSLLARQVRDTRDWLVGAPK